MLTSENSGESGKHKTQTKNGRSVSQNKNEYSYVNEEQWC